MLQEPLKFAVIGCGALARGQHIPNIAKSSKTVLHTCCDLSDEALKECKEVHGARHISKDWEAAVKNPDIDAICLATTEKLRLPVIKLAAEYGKPMYVEKPLATSLEEVYEIQKVVNESGIPFCVGHNRRCSPAMIDAQRIFRQQMDHPEKCLWRWDREGDDRPARDDNGVPSFSCRINDDWFSWKSWVFDKTQAPHGPMLFEMTHFTDICNWFLNNDPVEVVAMETGMLNHAIIVKYSGGAVATLNLTGNGTFGYPKELYEAFGNGSAVVCDHMCEVRTAGIASAPAKTTYPFLKDRHPDVGTQGGISGWLEKKAAACKEAAETGDQTLQMTAEPDKGHAHAMDNFVDEILGNGPVVCGVDSSVMATRVAFAAIKSAKEGRIVKMSEI
ncbi:MAG: Gfo/Idh/MocA family oxidoreductase [Victivallaceae bacterium]|nr:Gfo/Idh/MocA family oxidoreductase [Victivallaceae bacterium]